MIFPLWLAVLTAGPAGAQNRVAPPIEIRVSAGTSAGAAAAPSVLSLAPLVTAAPTLAVPVPHVSAALAAVPLPAAAFAAPALAASPRAAASVPARLSGMAGDVKRAAAALTGGAPVSGDQARSAGRELEDLLTGAESASAADASTPATASELDFAASAGSELGRRADDLGAARGLKSSGMTGADFVALVDDARRAADADAASPSPAAARAAAMVRASLLRVVRALVPAAKPFSESARRALAVWQVFDQEMGVAAGRGSLDAVAAEAELFASQVEASVEPPVASAPELTPSQPHPEDPHGYAAVNVPGSVFGWRPIESSPDHGLPFVDAVVRRALSERKNPARSEGFELPGAARREDARVYFYGERHTDGGLIAANMKRLTEDARPGGAAIVLVEGYTGWTMRGYDASKHPLLQHHMELLELNQLAYAPARGWRYYRDFARAAWRAWRGWLAMWRAAIVDRNADLDRAVARAAADAEVSGATVHVIAGSDHLIQNPRLGIFFPRLARPRFRAALAAALGGRPYWVSRPPETAP